MVDHSFIQGAGGPRPLSSQAPTPTSGATSSDSVAFRALLEKLEGQAKNLARATEDVSNPLELAGAVDSAKESLTDALSLRDRLFEAYRAAQQSSGFDDPNSPTGQQS